jgi:glycosyltransferase involved in cell wall biosynthesis
MSSKKIHIATLLMVKNEKKRLHVSLESVKNFTDSLIIFDTGSTDNTIDICKEFCEKNNIELRLKQGEFVNFSVSRNESLEFADTFDDIDYLLLLDVNDELRGAENLRKYAEEYYENPSSGFLLCQEWWSGQHDKYYNVRFIKAHKEWRYVGAVHEYIKTFNSEYDKHPIVKLPDNVILFQDRTQDDDKSGKRFKRDKELLLADFEKDPNEPRTCFYLAQTCACLQDNEEALMYYKIRSKLEGFQEEKFHAFLRCGELTEKLKFDWYDAFVYYMKAFEHTHRAEPLLYIANHYMIEKSWILAYTYLKLACNLSYPTECILFVNRLDYDYKRWHMMGISAYYCGQFVDGKNACLIAIEFAKNNPSRCYIDIDQKNLQFYLEKEKELNQNNNNNNQQINNNIIKNEIVTKKQFIDKLSSELIQTNPKLTQKQLHTRVTMAWKNHQKQLKN